ncbi:ATP synthase mitochondrial F1 complex assembly factor 2 [Galendromus occidentalis]|uniref:ATP synthase mitochondrial F1 complex assembly factor 2 n=1 Tax=Galendromus occidentalis TaxID=34638 RepID=A0AAJ6VWF5_9ACAR|nr:ATP synthase mitochondrial F1 complex assembly factor 2 [Galendromus occidentalis]
MQRRLVCSVASALRVRGMSSLPKPKKFYKNVSIVKSIDGWEVNLDDRKLKTPAGKLLTVPNEAIAAAIATEWAIQKNTIERHAMHLTSLANTSIDNPHNKTAEQLCEEIVEFLEHDSLLFRMPKSENAELYELQCEKWDPILEWFSERHQVKFEPSMDIVSPEIPATSVLAVYKDLFSHSRAALFGMQFAVEGLKSLILAQAAIDRVVTVDEAVDLSRLETDFQIKKWGSVEWSHELDKQQVKARLAASVLYFQLCEESVDVKTKPQKR